MEVSTVFPPSASPTGGDDLCETDVTDLAMHSVTLLMGLCGLVGNGAVLCLLTLKVRDAGICDMAVTDFFFLLFTVPSSLLFLVEGVSCSPIMSLVYARFVFQLSMVSYYWGLFRLSAFRIVKDMDVLCWLCCRLQLPRRLWWLVWGTRYWEFYVLITVIPSVTLLCPSHEQEHCRAALISMFAIILLLFAAPAVISSTIDLIKAKCGSQQQQPKRRDIVIFIIVLFTLLLNIWNFLQQFGYIVASSQVVLLLACINSSIKPFLYFLAGSSWRSCSVGSCWRHCTMGSLRESLRRVFEEQKEKPARSNDAPRKTGVSAC